MPTLTYSMCTGIRGSSCWTTQTTRCLSLYIYMTEEIVIAFTPHHTMGRKLLHRHTLRKKGSSAVPIGEPLLFSLCLSPFLVPSVEWFYMEQKGFFNGFSYGTAEEPYNILDRKKGAKRYCLACSLASQTSYFWKE